MSRHLYDYYKDCPMERLRSVNSSCLFMMNEALADFDTERSAVCHFERQMSAAAMAKREGRRVIIPKPLDFGKPGSEQEMRVKKAQSEVQKYLMEFFFGY